MNRKMTDYHNTAHSGSGEAEKTKEMKPDQNIDARKIKEDKETHNKRALSNSHKKISEDKYEETKHTKPKPKKFWHRLFRSKERQKQEKISSKYKEGKEGDILTAIQSEPLLSVTKQEEFSVIANLEVTTPNIESVPIETVCVVRSTQSCTTDLSSKTTSDSAECSKQNSDSSSQKDNTSLGSAKTSSAVRSNHSPDSASSTQKQCPVSPKPRLTSQDSSKKQGPKYSKESRTPAPRNSKSNCAPPRSKESGLLERAKKSKSPSNRKSPIRTDEKGDSDTQKQKETQEVRQKKHITVKEKVTTQPAVGATAVRRSTIPTKNYCPKKRSEDRAFYTGVLNHRHKHNVTSTKRQVPLEK